MSYPIRAIMHRSSWPNGGCARDIHFRENQKRARRNSDARDGQKVEQDRMYLYTQHKICAFDATTQRIDKMRARAIRAKGGAKNLTSNSSRATYHHNACDAMSLQLYIMYIASICYDLC